MTYSIVDHVCKFCKGRLLSRPLALGNFEFLCADCGHKESGVHVEAACMCGFRIKGKKIYACVLNENKSATYPFQVIAKFIAS